MFKESARSTEAQHGDSEPRSGCAHAPSASKCSNPEPASEADTWQPVNSGSMLAVEDAFIRFEDITDDGKSESTVHTARPDHPAGCYLPLASEVVQPSVSCSSLATLHHELSAARREVDELHQTVKELKGTCSLKNASRLPLWSHMKLCSRRSSSSSATSRSRARL